MNGQLQHTKQMSSNISCEMLQHREAHKDLISWESIISGFQQVESFHFSRSLQGQSATSLRLTLASRIHSIAIRLPCCSQPFEWYSQWKTHHTIAEVRRIIREGFLLGYSINGIYANLKLRHSYSSWRIEAIQYKIYSQTVRMTKPSVLKTLLDCCVTSAVQTLHQTRAREKLLETQTS